MSDFLFYSLALIGAMAVAALLWVALWLPRKNTAPRNSVLTGRSTILKQMNEPRPLPMGQKEFVEWTDRIISGALVPTEDRESLVGILAAMIMELPQTEDHKPDAFFIHKLRKAAANEVAHANFQAIKRRRTTEAQSQTPRAVQT